MTAGRPAGAVTEKAGVVHVADKNDSSRGLNLGMTFQAQVGIALDEHLGVNGAVRVVADRAAFAQRGVLENEGTGLFAMTLGAGLVLPRHGESPGGLHDVHSVRIVALDAVHFPLNDRVMLGEMKFSPGFLVTLETRFGIFAGIDDEFFQSAAAGHRNVLAAGTMAGFAAALGEHFGVSNPQSRVRTAREHAGDIGMTIKTRLVAHVGSAFDLQRGNNNPVGGAGIEQQNQRCCASAKR